MLLRVYQANDLKRFIGFETFARSVFVLESNREYDQLAAEYQARLADPKLTTVDRERIQKEFEGKRASLNKSGYSLSFVSSGETAGIPRLTLAKVLSDILATWARQAAVEKRVLDYQVPALSMNILERTIVSPDDFVVALVILRSKINDITANIEQLSKIPGIELVRAPSTRGSLQEVRLEIQDITRFRIEPLIKQARTGGLARNPIEVVRILESALTFDQRALTAAQQRESAVKDALAIYQEERAGKERSQGTPASGQRPSAPAETVMPQLGESFLDKVVDLTNQTADRAYRQKLVDEIKQSALAIVPIQMAVTYDAQVLNEFKAGQAASRASEADLAEMRQQWNQVHGDVARTLTQINEIYTVASKQLNPVTELFSVTGPVQARADRAVSLSRLLLYGILVFLISIPVVIGGCLIHNRIREEEEMEAVAHTGEAV
ncbi:MAG: hypothetical protein M3P29_09695 [Acidobacteriota bacterium]|nr:hypothetical protein [Acidobacteriota bacterium]